MSVRGITVCVDDAPLLALTLGRNMRHFESCVVVTSLEDEATRAVADLVPNVRVVRTDAFTRHGAAFNKGLALEEGFDAMRREGAILIWDADILLPDSGIPLAQCTRHAIYGARRRIVPDVAAWSPEGPWAKYRYWSDGGPVGFFQLFHAEDPTIFRVRPWYNVNFPHAGGGDAEFMEHWTPDRRVVLPLDVLHFGMPDRNWFGVDRRGRARMASFAFRMRWTRAMRLADRTLIPESEPVPERIEVPGYVTSDYKMPFERRGP